MTEKQFLKLVFDTLNFNLELINFLKEKYRIIILSDNFKENISYISKRFNFSSWSELEFYSYEFKMTKSNKELFSIILNKLNVKPENCIFIDDDIININNVKKLGVKGILFKNNEDLFDKIKML